MEWPDRTRTRRVMLGYNGSTLANILEKAPDGSHSCLFYLRLTNGTGRSSCTAIWVPVESDTCVSEATGGIEPAQIDLTAFAMLVTSLR